MVEVRKTDEFDRWIANLQDLKARAKILTRIQRLELGNLGISEMRIDYGPGYRVYYKRTGQEIVLLLCGGDKSTQNKDINHAKELAAEI